MPMDKILNSSGGIELQKLAEYADKMPQLKFNNTKQFKALFENIEGKYGYIKTPYKDIKIDIPYAYRHFYINTNNTNRNFIKSAFFETFKNPLFIAKDSASGRDSVYFYKPFFDKDRKLLNIFGIGVDSKGEVIYKTFYQTGTEQRLKSILKNAEILYSSLE